MEIDKLQEVGIGQIDIQKLKAQGLQTIRVSYLYLCQLLTRL